MLHEGAEGAPVHLRIGSRSLNAGVLIVLTPRYKRTWRGPNIGHESGILTEVFILFLRQTNSRVVSQLRPRPFFLTSFPIHYPLITLSFGVVLPELLTASLNKPQINKIEHIVIVVQLLRLVLRNLVFKWTFCFRFFFTVLTVDNKQWSRRLLT
jgi:hypothetical protein